MELLEKVEMENTSALLSSGCYKVQKIVGISIDDDCSRMFKVQWESTWVPEKNLMGCEKMILEFLKEQQEKVTENPGANIRIPNTVKVEGGGSVPGGRNSCGTSSNEEVHFQYNKTCSSSTETAESTEHSLEEQSSFSEVSIEPVQNNIRTQTDREKEQHTHQKEHQLRQAQQLLQPDHGAQEPSIDNNHFEHHHQEQLLHVLPQPLVTQGLSSHMHSHQLQSQQLRDQQQGSIYPENLQIQIQEHPSYDFLDSFYRQNSEFVNSCKSQKQFDSQRNLATNYGDKELLKPYSGGHSLFLRVVNNIIEQRDLTGKGNKVDRVKAVEEIMLILGMKNSVENTQRISKRLSKLIASKKHQAKIKKNAAELGMSYNRYRNVYVRKKNENSTSNQSNISDVSNPDD